MKLLRITFRFLLVFLLFSLGVLAATNFFDFRLSQRKISRAFADLEYSAEHHFVETGNGKLHYLSIGDSAKTPLLMIHGSPGSWDNFVSLISETDILSNYFVLAVDRPGYGNSTLPHTPHLQEQAAVIDTVLKKHFTEKGVILGHSYGAAVALAIAAKNPSYIKTVLSIAGTIAPRYQEPRWYNYAVRFTPVQWLLSDLWLKSNKEMWHLPDGLVKTQMILSQTDFPIVVLQGGKDWLVNSHSAQYFKAQFAEGRVEILWQDDMNHFVIWTHEDVVQKALSSISAQSMSNSSH